MSTISVSSMRQDEDDIRCFCMANDVMAVVNKKTNRLLVRSMNNTSEAPFTHMLSHKAYQVFLDPTGQHVFLSTVNGDFYYFNPLLDIKGKISLALTSYNPDGSAGWHGGHTEETRTQTQASPPCAACLGGGEGRVSSEWASRSRSRSSHHHHQCPGRSVSAVACTCDIHGRGKVGTAPYGSNSTAVTHTVTSIGWDTAANTSPRSPGHVQVSCAGGLEYEVHLDVPMPKERGLVVTVQPLLGYPDIWRRSVYDRATAAYGGSG